VSDVDDGAEAAEDDVEVVVVVDVVAEDEDVVVISNTSDLDSVFVFAGLINVQVREAQLLKNDDITNRFFFFLGALGDSL